MITDVETPRGTIQREKIYVYGTCEQCGEADVLVYECGDKLYCAEHTRQYAREFPRPQLCDKCGSDNIVFRDPSHRRNEYLCWDCHVEVGTTIRDTVTARAARNLAQKDNS